MQLDLDWIASSTGATRARLKERVQSLWSGYGEIVRVELTGSDQPTAIVKWVKPKVVKNNVSHARKCKSYAVETEWYSAFADRCGAESRVPKLFAKRVGPDRDERILVMEDLNAYGFDRRTHSPNESQLSACIEWLAAFHARFLGVAPNGLWKTGTYWHLSTRRDELNEIGDVALREAAPAIDRALESCTFRTFVHGDAKPANFCFSRRNDVAAVDFQYVGGGCGMKDVAYLLDGGTEATEEKMLNRYFASLRGHLAGRTEVDGAALESEWRRMYPIACADFIRFLAGWSKMDLQRHPRARERVNRVIASLASAANQP